jgi:hypothetical protein
MLLHDPGELKKLLFLNIQNESAVYHVGDAVVVAFPFPTDTNLSHGESMHQNKSVHQNNFK